MSFLPVGAEHRDPYGTGTYGSGVYGGGIPAYPEISVEIDFTNNPTNPTRTWTSVTADVRDIAYTRGGRNHELQRTEAGTLTCVLDNRAGDYDPSNTGSPHYPGVKRMRWIRVRARWDEIIYPRWQGLIETWEQEWPSSGKDAIVRVDATDTFKVLNLFDLFGLSYGEQDTGDRVADVLASTGVLSSTIDTGQTTIIPSGTFPEGSLGLSHLLQVEESENGLVFAEADGGITFQNRHYRLLNSATSEDTIGDDTGEIPYRSASANLDDADIYNSVTVTPAGGTPETATDTSSQEAHYTRKLSRDILTSSQTEARSAAEYLVGRYADPSQRIPDVELLGVQDSQRYTFKRRADANTISEDVFVERVGDRVTPGTAWDVRLQLSPADSQSSWVLGDATYSVLGSTTRPAY
jgi:hypothetical protein